ncbi:PadR family transcriptional regulator [Streptomyces armeniacus]|uniref:PadR family transcriptional regulator n=1 Tax=Streptomyces armeniacus TaxID=83291 RepID=A0A345XSN2_9ACTN|nr:PadR family transcriptional regulator [Streptomyces armeniacus]AXK34648.1 PadR family transcriptional regulator [Streptomyces armeniacus]
MTLPTQLVLQVLLEQPSQELYGLQIGSQAGLASGTIHPILARLEAVGWLTSRWEDSDRAHQQGRPRRRYYQLSQEGCSQAPVALARAKARRNALRGMSLNLPGEAHA